METTKTITLQELTEKIAVVMDFTAEGSDERKCNLNGMRFLVGEEIFKAAMSHWELNK